MNGFANDVIATEGKRDVADATADQCMGQRRLDFSRRFYEIETIAVVFLDSRGNGENIRIENDIGRIEADLVHENVVGSPADLYLALGRIRLPGLVERHDDDSGTVIADQACLPDEYFFAFLQTDRVDDTLALHAPEPCFDHGPPGGIDHYRHASDVGLGCDQVQVGDHCALGVEHAFVHVDVNELGAILDLLPGDLYRVGVAVCLDQFPEDRRAGNVGALPDIDEQIVRTDIERLQSRQPASDLDLRNAARLSAVYDRPESADVVGCRSTTSPHQVDEAARGKFADDRCHVRGRLVVLTEFVRQPGIWVRADAGIGNPGQLRHVRPQILGAERAVQADHERLGVPDRVPERLGGLPRQCPARSIGNRPRNHHRQLDATRLERPSNGENCRLRIQRVEDGFDHEKIRAARDQRGCRLFVSRGKLGESDIAETRVVDVRRDRRCPVRRPEHAGHESRNARIRCESVCNVPRDSCRGFVQLRDQLFHAVVTHRRRIGIEGIRFNDVRARPEEPLVNLANDFRASKTEQIVVSFHIRGPVAEPFAAVIGLRQPESLDHRSHCTIEQQDPLVERLHQGFDSLPPLHGLCRLPVRTHADRVADCKCQLVPVQRIEMKLLDAFPA